jgi:hypothetical protein
MFSGVLVLLMRFALPIRDAECTEDILHFAANLDLSTITDKLLGRSSMASNIVL